MHAHPYVASWASRASPSALRGHAGGDEAGAAAAPTANGPFSCLLLCEWGTVGHCQDWPNHSSVPSNVNLQLCNNTVSAQDCASLIMCSIYYWGEQREAPLFWVVRNRKTWHVPGSHGASSPLHSRSPPQRFTFEYIHRTFTGMYMNNWEH